MSHTEYQQEFINKIRPFLPPDTRYKDVFKNFRRGGMGLSLTLRAFNVAKKNNLLFFKHYEYDDQTFTAFRRIQFDIKQKSPYYVSSKYVYISDPEIMSLHEMIQGDIAKLSDVM